MITCPACGTENAVGSNFCIACGTDLNTTATDHQLRTDSAPARNPPRSPETASPEVPLEYLGVSNPPGPTSAPTPQAPVDIPPEYLDQPVASPAAPPGLVHAPIPPQTQPSYIPSASALKNPSLALVLEIGGGLIGLPGIGWIYSGQLIPGLILLGVMIGLDVAALVLAVFTVSVSCLCSVPLTWVVMGVSSTMLYRYTRNHTELFAL